MKIKQTLNPTTTPMSRRGDEAAETGEHDKHTDRLVSHILFDTITDIHKIISIDF